MFSEFDSEPTQVSILSGGTVRSVVADVTGAFVMLGSGQTPGEGTCEQYWTLNEVEVPKGTLFSQSQFEGMARGSAVLHAVLTAALASQNVVWVMAVWGPQLRGARARNGFGAELQTIEVRAGAC